VQHICLDELKKHIIDYTQYNWINPW